MLEVKRDKKKPDLLSLVKSHIDNESFRSSGSMVGCGQGYSQDWDNYGDDDDWQASLDAWHNGDYGDKDIFRLPKKVGKSKGKSTRRGGKGKSNKSIVDDYNTRVSPSDGSRLRELTARYGMTCVDDDDYDDYDYNDDDKTIYFYPDYSINNDFVEFSNLHAFGEYLDSEGINVSSSEMSDLRYRTVSHCCINPLDKFNHGELNLISDHSYGALYYTCCEYEYS